MSWLCDGQGDTVEFDERDACGGTRHEYSQALPIVSEYQLCIDGGCSRVEEIQIAFTVSNAAASMHAPDVQIMDALC